MSREAEVGTDGLCLTCGEAPCCCVPATSAGGTDAAKAATAGAPSYPFMPNAGLVNKLLDAANRAEQIGRDGLADLLRRAATRIRDLENAVEVADRQRALASVAPDPAGTVKE